jgi:hypothetical protein
VLLITVGAFADDPQQAAQRALRQRQQQHDEQVRRGREVLDRDGVLPR